MTGETRQKGRKGRRERVRAVGRPGRSDDLFQVVQEDHSLAAAGVFSRGKSRRVQALAALPCASRFRLSSMWFGAREGAACSRLGAGALCASGPRGHHRRGGLRRPGLVPPEHLGDAAGERRLQHAQGWLRRVGLRDRALDPARGLG